MIVKDVGEEVYSNRFHMATKPFVSTERSGSHRRMGAQCEALGQEVGPRSVFENNQSIKVLNKATQSYSNSVHDEPMCKFKLYLSTLSPEALFWRQMLFVEMLQRVKDERKNTRVGT